MPMSSMSPVRLPVMSRAVLVAALLAGTGACTSGALLHPNLAAARRAAAAGQQAPEPQPERPAPPAPQPATKPATPRVKAAPAQVAPVAPPRIVAIPLGAASHAPAPSVPLALPREPATLVFTHSPDPRCTDCETLKLTVSPSGEVLIERSHWDQGHIKWHYRRTTARTTPDRAASFAAFLAAPCQPSGPASATPSETTVTVGWIAPSGTGQQTLAGPCAARLAPAPDRLGLPQLALPRR